MVKKHMCTLGELLHTLKKQLQDHKAFPWHNIEEITDNVQHIQHVLKGSGWKLEPDQEELFITACEIINQYKKEKAKH